MPITRKRIKWSRNWPCLCGSEKKYKNCCMNEIESLTISDGNAKVRKLSEDVEKMIAAEQEARESARMKGNVNG